MEMPFRTGIIYVIMGGDAEEEWEGGMGMEFCSAIEWNFCGFSVGFFFFIYLWSFNAAGFARQGPGRPGPTKTVKWITVSRSVQRRRGLMNIKQQAQCDDRSSDPMTIEANELIEQIHKWNTNPNRNRYRNRNRNRNRNTRHTRNVRNGSVF